MKVMQEREISRGDRFTGLSNDQATRVHQGEIALYDFTVDTSLITPDEAACQILNFVQANPMSRAMRKLIAN